MTLRPVCIAQLIQVELFRRRFCLAQIHAASLPNSRFFMLFVYSFAISFFNLIRSDENRLGSDARGREALPFGQRCKTALGRKTTQRRKRHQ